MNLLAVTVTLSIQTCIVRLYNVKKKIHNTICTLKQIKKKHFFFIIM